MKQLEIIICKIRTGKMKEILQKDFIRAIVSFMYHTVISDDASGIPGGRL